MSDHQRCSGCGCSDPDGDDCPGVIWSESPDRCICHALAEMGELAALMEQESP